MGDRFKFGRNLKWPSDCVANKDLCPDFATLWVQQARQPRARQASGLARCFFTINPIEDLLAWLLSLASQPLRWRP